MTRWTLDQTDGGLTSSPSDFCFLHWDDIARSNWPRSPLLILWQYAGVAWFYLFRGRLFHLANLCPGVALCGAYPLLFIAFSFCLACLSIPLTIAALKVFTGLQLIQLFSGVLVGLGVLYFAWKLGNKLGIAWLTRSILFTHRLGQLRDVDLRQRIKEFADQLMMLEIKEPSLDITLVGHSSGSFVLAMLAAELHRRPDAAFLLTRIKLLTLGQNIANLAVYPKAQFFRDDLQELTTAPRIPWRDVTSSQDFLCYAGVNPYSSCGLPIPIGEPYPQMETVDFAKARGLTKMWDLMSNQFDLHFDYLRNISTGVGLFEQLTLRTKLSEL